LVAPLFGLQAASVPIAEFPFQYRDELLWIEVNLPQSTKPLNFLLDSGAGASVINLRTAKHLGLKPGKDVAVHGVAGILPGYWQHGVSAKVGDIELPHEYLAVDLEKLSHTCGRRVDGLVGADFFRGHVVQIDFDSHKIRLLKPENAKTSGEALPLQLRASGMCLPICVNGHKDEWVRLDTGCATALEWVTSEVKPEPGARQMAIGLAAISIPQAKTAVGIGDREFENVPTGLHETAIFPGEAGLLGNGLLARFSTVTIDVGAGHVTFDDRHPSP
jgi:hypothetical protein